MLRLIVKRTLEAIPVLICILTLTFVLARWIPGGPFDRESNASPEVIASLKAHYGYDQPLWKQYLTYFKNLLKGNLGPSMRYQGCTVNELLKERIPISFELGFWAMLLSATLGISVGMLSALKQNSTLDHILMSSCMIGLSLPTFVIGPLLILLFGLKLQWVQAVGWAQWSDRILPTLTLACMYTGYIARLTRSSLLEVIRQNFIRTAQAKGLSNGRIFFIHALRNALGPVINYLGPTAAAIISGSLVIESLFHIPGAGSLFIMAVGQRDDALLLGTVLYLALLVVIFNLLVDLCLILLNPTQKTVQ